MMINTFFFIIYPPEKDDEELDETQHSRASGKEEPPRSMETKFMS